jgi:hypothetical protein
VVKYDERQAFTSNHAYRTPSARAEEAGGGAGTAVDDALSLGFGTWRVETAEEVLQVRATKSGEALVHRARHLLGNAKGGGNGGVVGGGGQDLLSGRVKNA